jgi:Ni2+-binding GTPase involved in maturation of urease and hydrogenase
MLALCLALRDKYSIAAVTNDIFTREDCEFLTRHKALPAERIRAIETGGCPHAAVREDISTNLAALTDLHNEFSTQLLLIESGGDNLAANYSRELAAPVEATPEALRKHPAAFPELLTTSSRTSAGMPELRAAMIRLLDERGA